MYVKLAWLSMCRAYLSQVLVPKPGHFTRITGVDSVPKSLLVWSCALPSHQFHEFNSFWSWVDSLPVVKNSPADAGDMGSVPGLGKSPGKGNDNPAESHGQRSLAGYSPWGHRVSDTTWARNTDRLWQIRNTKRYSWMLNASALIVNLPTRRVCKHWGWWGLFCI